MQLNVGLSFEVESLSLNNAWVRCCVRAWVQGGVLYIERQEFSVHSWGFLGALFFCCLTDCVNFCRRKNLRGFPRMNAGSLDADPPPAIVSVGGTFIFRLSFLYAGLNAFT